MIWRICETDMLARSLSEGMVMTRWVTGRTGAANSGSWAFSSACEGTSTQGVPARQSPFTLTNCCWSRTFVYVNMAGLNYTLAGSASRCWEVVQIVALEPLISKVKKKFGARAPRRQEGAPKIGVTVERTNSVSQFIDSHALMHSAHIATHTHILQIVGH